MKRMEVTILGQSYVLSCPDGGEAALTEAATKVDREMCGIRDAGKLKARERIAVLAALKLAYEITDRPAALAAAAAAAPPATPRASTSAGQEDPAQMDALMASLIARIDETLADDGRLI